MHILVFFVQSMFGMCQIVNTHCLDSFLERFGTNVPEDLEVLGLVLKTRAELRIVDKSMPM